MREFSHKPSIEIEYCTVGPVYAKQHCIRMPEIRLFHHFRWKRHDKDATSAAAIHEQRDGRERSVRRMPDQPNTRFVISPIHFHHPFGMYSKVTVMKT